MTLWFVLWFVIPTTDEDADYVVFFCGHIYHRRCVSTKNEVGIACIKHVCVCVCVCVTGGHRNEFFWLAD